MISGDVSSVEKAGERFAAAAGRARQAIATELAHVALDLPPIMDAAIEEVTPTISGKLRSSTSTVPVVTDGSVTLTQTQNADNRGFLYGRVVRLGPRNGFSETPGAIALREQHPPRIPNRYDRKAAPVMIAAARAHAQAAGVAALVDVASALQD